MATPEDCPLISADEEMLTNALVAAADRILDDEARMRKFWRGGYEALVEHAVDGSARYLGKRILTWVITTLAVFLAWIAIKTGVFKP